MGKLTIENKHGVTEIDFPPKKTKADASKDSQKRKSNKQASKRAKPKE